MGFAFNSNFGGSHAIFCGHGGIPDLAGYRFTTAGSGQGKSVKNNAASAWADSIYAGNESVIVYYNSNYSGPCDWFYLQGGLLRLLSWPERTTKTHPS